MAGWFSQGCHIQKVAARCISPVRMRTILFASKPTRFRIPPNPDFSAIARIFSGAQLNRDVEAELNWDPSTNHSSRQIEGDWPHLSDRILVAGSLSIVFFVVLRR